jgi:hypothetical protein
MATSATHFSTTANDRERRGPVTPTAAYKLLAELLRGADVVLDGDRPWDMVVRDPRMARRILAQGSLGAGESYMTASTARSATDAAARHARTLRHEPALVPQY